VWQSTSEQELGLCGNNHASIRFRRHHERAFRDHGGLGRDVRAVVPGYTTRATQRNAMLRDPDHLGEQLEGEGLRLMLQVRSADRGSNIRSSPPPPGPRAGRRRLGEPVTSRGGRRGQA